jgi:hypothetical protein
MTERQPTRRRWLLLIPLAGSIVVAMIGGVYIFNGLSATAWEKTEATILESGFPLKYEFTVDGKRHHGSVVRHSFMNPSDDDLLEQYPVGKQVTVYYAPSEGTYLSVLEPGFHVDTVLVTLLAMVMFFLCWRWFRPAAVPREEQQNSEPPADG